MTSIFADVVSEIQSGTHAVIDLDAYSANIGVLRSIVPSNVQLMAVVKADAYGHGAVECGRAALLAGATMLGVARIQEARYLRRAGINGKILVIGPPTLGELDEALDLDVSLTVGSHTSVDNVLASVGGGRSARLHVKLDTGMNRYGFDGSELCEVVERLVTNPDIDVEGVYTHFSSADEVDRGPTEQQIERFWSAVSRLDNRKLRPRYVHTCNSAGVLTGQWQGTNLVRSGIATYGLSPSPEVSVDARFRPVLSLRSVVSRRATLRACSGVSYGQTYRAVVDEQIAAIPIGYADGLPRGLRNQGWFVVGGNRAPIEGSVCMDQTVVGVRDDVAEGDPVRIVGDGSGGEMTFDTIADLVGTVNYEVATRVMARVPRLYLREGEVVAWERVLTGERGRIGE